MEIYFSPTIALTTYLTEKTGEEKISVIKLVPGTYSVLVKYMLTSNEITKLMSNK